MSIRLLIADDHEAIRAGVKSMLEGSNIQVTAEACGGNEAVEQVVKHRPDVVLLDVRMPQCDGLRALERIIDRSPGTKVVMFTGYDNSTYIARAVALGAADYLLKDSSRDIVLGVIARVHTSLPPDADSLLGRMRNLMARRQPKHDYIPLTNREVQVLRHLALGLSNREIGKSLEIGIETVKEHVQNTLRKLDAGDRTEAAVWAVKHGLV